MSRPESFYFIPETELGYDLAPRISIWLPSP